MKSTLRINPKCVCAMFAAICCAWVANAQPLPVWSSNLDSDTAISGTGGTVVNPPSTYVPGYSGNAFAGNASVYGRWDNATVASIFDSTWVNANGSTIDLYFQGNHWSTHTGDSGLFAIVDRLGGFDGHYIVSVRAGRLRLPYRDSYDNSYLENYTTLTLNNDVTYHLTVRQLDTAFELYLDDIGGSQYDNSAPVYTATALHTFSFPAPNAGTGSSGRQMTVANRSSYFGGPLQAGEWVDQISVYNGFYTPAQLVPEPGALTLLGMGLASVVVLRRKRHR